MRAVYFCLLDLGDNVERNKAEVFFAGTHLLLVAVTINTSLKGRRGKLTGTAAPPAAVSTPASFNPLVLPPTLSNYPCRIWDSWKTTPLQFQV